MPHTLPIFFIAFNATGFDSAEYLSFLPIEIGGDSQSYEYKLVWTGAVSTLFVEIFYTHVLKQCFYRTRWSYYIIRTRVPR
jgi:hypothetical protein